MQPESVHDSDKMKYGKIQAILLSYFHRIKGPQCFFEYPSNRLSDQIREDIARIMDLSAEPKIFTQNTNEINSINDFFEIPSNWARGSQERVMISIVFFENISHDFEQTLHPLLQDFEARLKNTEGIFKGFYAPDEFEFTSSKEQQIQAMKKLLQSWVKGLYYGAQLILFDNWAEQYITELNFLTEDQILVIQNILRSEGIQILDRIRSGAKTREDLSKSSEFSPKSIAETILYLIRLDLITEGSELVITNRGKKVLNAINLLPQFHTGPFIKTRKIKPKLMLKLIALFHKFQND